MADINAIADQIQGLSLLEASQLVKMLEEITSLGLKEAKDLVDGAPKPIKEGVNKDEAAAIQKKFVDAGATVEIK